MLHNSEPYGPSEVPTNMEVPVNKSQITGSANMVQNLSSIGKLGQNQHQQLLQQFNGPDYLTYDLPNHAIGAQSHNFGRHSLDYASRITNSTSHTEYDSNITQSGLFPYFEACNSSTKSYNSDFPTKIHENNTNESNNHVFVTNSSLSISEVPIKREKPPTSSNNTMHSTSSKEKVKHEQNSESNAVINQETKDKYLRIENAVKHIESRILASNKSVKPKKHTQRAVNNVPQNTVTNKVLSEAKTKGDTGLVITDMCNKKSVKIKIKKEPIEVEIETSEENDLWTDVEFTNPFVKDINAVTKDCVLNVIRNSEGVIKDSVINVNIVSKSTSVEEAMNTLNNGPDPSPRYYECPDCGVLHQNVKRFLVHVKWHSFGLTNSMRTEREQAKNVKRAMRSGEVILGSNDDMDGVGKYPCKDCHKVFAKQTSLKNHRHKFHKAKPRDCLACSLTFNDWKALREHHATAHPANEGFACTHCGKMYKYRHTLAKHVHTHFEKTHACEQCPKKFGSDLLLKQHMRTHERIERGAIYCCTSCGKGFFESYNLKLHEQTHRNERPFACSICNSTFATNSTMKRHVRVSHSKTKPYECSTCHRCFTTSLIRDRHEQRVHGNEDKFQHPCVKCGRKFRTEEELNRHACRGMPRGTRVKDEGE